MIFAGYTEGNWSATNVGGQNFAAVRAVSSFSGTPTIASPTATDEESSETPVRTIVLLPILVTLSLFALFGIWACWATRRSSRGGASNDGGSACEQERCAAELERARRLAPPVARPVGSREVERNGGAAHVVAQECGAVPYAHAVAVPATSDADGSGRAWPTVVATEVLE